MFDLTLTFDNGPTEETPKVLDLLKLYGIKSTFFVVGQQIADLENRRHAQRAVAEGHWIGNHTFTHKYTFGQFENLEESLVEVTKTEDLIGNLLHPDHLIRPYADGGILDERVLNPLVFEYLKTERFSVVLWNSVPRDWERNDWVPRALDDCAVRPWTLMVLHDLPGMALPNLERFIPLAKETDACFRQDFPPECVPLRRGNVVMSMDHLVAKKPVRRSALPGRAETTRTGQ